MKLPRHIILILFIITSPLMGGVIQESQVSANAHWLLHVDAQRFKSSQIGVYIMQEYVEPNIPAIGPFNLNIQEVIKLIDGITIYGESMDFENMEESFDGIALIQAHPDLRAMLEAVIVMTEMQEEGESPFTVIQENPYKLIDLDGELRIAFFGDSLIVAGRSLQAIEDFAELQAGKRADLSHNPIFQDFGMQEGTVTVLAATEGFDQLADMPQARILKMTNGFLVRLDERSGQVTLDATLTTIDDATARQVKQVLQGILAMAALANVDDLQLSQLLRSAHTEAIGKRVNLGVAFPVDDVLTMAEAFKPPVVEGTDEVGGSPLSLKITKTSVDGEHIPGNIVDGDEGTYWAAPGKGQWIEMEFSSPVKVETLELMWFKGNERQESFKVQARTQAGVWKDLFEGSSGTDLHNLKDLNFEFVPISVTTTNAIRLIGNGNTSNEWNSLVESRINGGEVKPFKVVSSADSRTLPGNLFDKNIDTVWDTYNKAMEMDGYLTEAAVVREIGIVWSADGISGIRMETSQDGLGWMPVLSMDGRVKGGELQKYNVIDSTAKFIRIRSKEGSPWIPPAEFVLYGVPVTEQ